MRITLSLLLLVFGICLTSCCSQKTAAQEKIALKTTPIENGSETLYLLKNKSLDTISQNGNLSYEIKASSETDVIQYVYEINMDQVQYDGGLRETLVFEIPHGDFELNLTDESLQNSKMLFSRQCYCRGQNGVFRITKGNLKVTKRGKKIILDVNFNQNHVPQEIKTIHLE